MKRTFDAPTLAFLIGVPLLWAILLLFHPGGEAGEMYASIQDSVTPWLVVHLGMLIFIPLFAYVMYVLLRGVEGTAARVARIALLPYAVFYGAYETLQGIGNGVLVHNVNQLPASERGTGAELVQAFGENVILRDLGVLSTLGSVAFVVAAIATGLALHRHAGAPVAVPVLLGLSGFLITAHPPPFGPTGLALFIVAVGLTARAAGAGAQRRSSPAIRPPTTA
jgi:hypothetical protein